MVDRCVLKRGQEKATRKCLGLMAQALESHMLFVLQLLNHV